MLVFFYQKKKKIVTENIDQHVDGYRETGDDL